MEVSENTSRDARKSIHCSTGGLDNWNPAAPGWRSRTGREGGREGVRECGGRE